MADRPFTIGFANLSENLEFTRIVRDGIEKAAAERPDVTLLLRNNNMDDQTALANAQEFAALPVDLAILFHINERFNSKLSYPLIEKGIPIISIDVPIPLTIYFGADNRQAGVVAGEALAKWVQANWNGQIDKVLVLTDSRVLDVVRQRFTYALKRLGELTPFDSANVLYFDMTDDQQRMNRERALSLLNVWSDQHHIVIMGINDESVLEMIELARSLGREADVVGVGHGATMIEKAFEVPDSRFIGSVAYSPEAYGDRLMALADQIRNGQPVPRENYIDHVVITRANVDSHRHHD